MNTTDFLERVRQAAQLPSTDEDWTATALLTEASQCLEERFAQPLVNTRSGYTLQSKTITTTAGQATYRIPPRAVVQGLELFCVSSPGSTTQWRQLAVLTNAQSVDYMNLQGGAPGAFCFEADQIVLFPTPQQSQSLTFKYYLRAAQLAEVPTYSGVLTAVNSVSQLTVTSPDATPVPWTAGSLVDIRNLDGSCEAVAVDVTLSSVTDGTNVATLNLSTPLTSEQVSKLRGDGTQAVMTADTSWVIPLPAELCTALASYTAAVVLVDKGDAEKAAGIVSRCEAAVRAAMDLMQPRVKTRPFVFVSRNTYLRRRAGWQNGW